MSVSFGAHLLGWWFGCWFGLVAQTYAYSFGVVRVNRGEGVRCVSTLRPWVQQTLGSRWCDSPMLSGVLLHPPQLKVDAVLACILAQMGNTTCTCQG